MVMYNLLVTELIGNVVMKWTTHNGGYGGALTPSAAPHAASSSLG